MGLRDLAWLGHHGHGHLPPQKILGENSRGINQMVRHDSIQFSYPALQYLLIPQKIVR